MDDQSAYINQLQEGLEAKIEQIEKLEGWLRHIAIHYYDHMSRTGRMRQPIDNEIIVYVNAMEGK